jgi:hypothetical protein
VKARDLSEHNTRVTQAKDIVRMARDMLFNEPAEKDLKIQELKLLTERHRHDMSMMTSNKLQEFDFSSHRKLKVLYNYNMEQMREKKEAEQDVRDEFLHRKNHPEPMTEKLDLAMERKKHFGNRV